MPNVLLSAFTGEGDTDRRFLGPLIRRTLEELLWESPQQIDVYEPEWLGVAKSTEIVAASRRAAAHGHRLLVVHADADSNNLQLAHQQRIQPALDELVSLGIAAPIVVPLIPVHEVEAWMLADVDILITELATRLTAQKLGLHGDPERYADPKAKLAEAVRLANVGRGAHLHSTVGDLYAPLGEAVALPTLVNTCPSYGVFSDALRTALGEIGFL